MTELSFLGELILYPFPVAADVVVAINGVWILVETYTLNSKTFPRLT